MKAELLEILPWVTDRERAEEFSDQLENLLVEVGGIFPRADLRLRAARCVRGLLSPVSRKNGWQLAEYSGDAEPWGQQHLLDRSVWGVDELRDFTRRYVIDGLDDDGRGAGPGGAGVLVVDETGFAKKGRASVGVARQYSGTLGGVFPCQIGVMAAWATGRGQALIDREVYLPREWAEDRSRCRAAHVPDTVVFATKPRLAEQMIARIVPDLPEHRVWVAADEVYGRDGAFRAFLEENHLPYAVNVQANHTVLPRPGWRHAARLVERYAAEDDRVTLPAGPSQLDSRLWQWWVRRIPAPEAETSEGAWARWFIARRRPEAPTQRDYYVAWGPPETTVEELVRVPGARWRVEEAIKLGKSAAGMADYEVRSFHGRYRHITLAQPAAAFLAVQSATPAGNPESGPGPERIAEILHTSLDAPAHHTGGPRRPHQPCLHRPHRAHGV
ncbi:IS701 family transposase [Streptomyces erythrochromogenes]|uniref:IS701 family transposase n=1 Tax=Streptomyces erythrochromogenes TaxID=285574 RepID=UPI00343F89C4